MDISTSLLITPKGEEEVKTRIYKLGMKKRSLLILLARPQSVQHILATTLFPPVEVMEEIRALIADQFLVVSAQPIAPPGQPSSTPQPSSGMGLGLGLGLTSGIIVSEAKFLLIDFCVDNFGTQSQAYIDEISACGDEAKLALGLARVFAVAQKACPDKIPALLDVIREINDTA